MSSHSLRELLRQDGSGKPMAGDFRPAEETEIYQAFSFGRVGIRPQLMLCLVKCDGHHLVLPYADLRAIITSEPDKGFLLDFGGRELLIEGTSLLICFRYLRDHRLAELSEIDSSSAMLQPEGTPVVHKITIRKPRPGGDRSITPASL
jgi:hypothetical protein